MNVLPQVDFGEVPSPKKMGEAVVTKVLSTTVSHPRISSYKGRTAHSPMRQYKHNESGRQKGGYSQGMLLLSREYRLIYYTPRRAEFQPCALTIQGFLVYPYYRESLSHSNCKASRGWAQKWRI